MQGQVYDRVLKLPYRGAPQTVAVIGRAALESQGDYGVRQLAEDICAGLPSKDYVGEYLAIYHFLLANTRYMRDPRTVELVRDPARVAAEIRAGRKPSLDCDDLSALAAALGLAVGAHVRVVTVAFKNQFHNGHRQYSHVFCQFQDPISKKWITIDPVAASNSAIMLKRVVHATVWPIA